MPTFIVPLHEHNDCHNPAGPGGGRFCSTPGMTATGMPIWRTPLKDYLRSKGEYALPANATSEEENLWVESRRLTRQHEDQWMRGLKTAVATGEIDLAAAEQLAGGVHKLKPQTERGTWEELPRTLYHVTVNRDAVMASGLQTKGERGTSQAPGLGGGDSEGRPSESPPPSPSTWSVPRSPLVWSPLAITASPVDGDVVGVGGGFSHFPALGLRLEHVLDPPATRAVAVSI